MAIVAGVRHADFHSQIRSRHPETVVAAWIDHHKIALRHVAPRKAPLPTRFVK
ncbi:MAG: hypothetical protein R3C26_10580 [Calditrichia bacterium]